MTTKLHLFELSTALFDALSHDDVRATNDTLRDFARQQPELNRERFGPYPRFSVVFKFSDYWRYVSRAPDITEHYHDFALKMVTSYLGATIRVDNMTCQHPAFFEAEMQADKIHVDVSGGNAAPYRYSENMYDVLCMSFYTQEEFRAYSDEHRDRTNFLQCAAVCNNISNVLLASLACKNLQRDVSVVPRLATENRKAEKRVNVTYISRAVLSPPVFSAGGTGIIVRPHMRRAHLHTFWAGSDRSEKRIHMIPPIFVNGSPDLQPPAHDYKVQ